VKLYYPTSEGDAEEILHNGFTGKPIHWGEPDEAPADLYPSDLGVLVQEDSHTIPNEDWVMLEVTVSETEAALEVYLHEFESRDGRFWWVPAGLLNRGTIRFFAGRGGVQWHSPLGAPGPRLYVGVSPADAERIVAHGFSEVDEIHDHGQDRCGVLLTASHQEWAIAALTVLCVDLRIPLDQLEKYSGSSSAKLKRAFWVPAAACKGAHVAIQGTWQ
jgi:hypothetical protein